MADDPMQALRDAIKTAVMAQTKPQPISAFHDNPSVRRAMFSIRPPQSPNRAFSAAWRDLERSGAIRFNAVSEMWEVAGG